MQINSPKLKVPTIKAAKTKLSSPSTLNSSSDSFSPGPSTATKTMLTIGAGIVGAGVGAIPCAGAISNVFVGMSAHGKVPAGTGIAWSGALANIAGSLPLEGALTPGMKKFVYAAMAISGLAGGVVAAASTLESFNQTPSS